MTIQPIPRSLENSPFRLLIEDVQCHALGYLTIQELAKASLTCHHFNEHMTTRPFNDLRIKRGVDKIVAFCEEFIKHDGIQSQKIKDLFEQFRSQDSSCFLSRQVCLKALQDEIFTCEMRLIYLYGTFDVQTLESFSINILARGSLSFWSSLFPVSIALAKAETAQEFAPGLQSTRGYWRAYQEIALLSFAGKEGEIFVRAWKKEDGNSLIGEISDTFIEKVARKAISNKDYRATRNLAKIAKGYLSKLVISQLADKYEKNPKISRAPKEAIRSKKVYCRDISFPDYMRRAESQAKTLDALSKERGRKEKKERDKQYQKSLFQRTQDDSGFQQREVKKPWQQNRR